VRIFDPRFEFYAITDQRTALGRGDEEVACPQCGGSGKAQATCPRCAGHGVVTRTEPVEIRIKAGTRDGQRLRIAGKGNAGAGVPEFRRKRF